MEAHYSRAVRSEHTGDSPRDLLESPVTVLVGVDDEAQDALSSIDVENVHDLATSPVFDVARAVEVTASSGDPSGGVERTTAMAAANELADGDLSELAAADVGELEGVDEAAAEKLRSALGVATVRDLARWPPFRGARTILGALTGVGARTDDGVPNELVPIARKYATETNYYTKVYIDEVVEDLDEYVEGDGTEFSPGDLIEDIKEHDLDFDWSPQWERIVESLEEAAERNVASSDSGEFDDTNKVAEIHHITANQPVPMHDSSRELNLLSTVRDRRIDLAAHDPEVGGFRLPAVGGLIQFEQSWVPQGLSLGQLLHSTTLAPGESTKIAVVDWSRRTAAQREETGRQLEEMQAEMVQNRSIQEVQDGVTAEVQEGNSTVSSTSVTEQVGATENRGVFGTGGSESFGASFTETTTETVSTSKGRREVHAEMTQNIHNATQQHASSARTRRATVVRETDQEEHEEVRTRVLTNHNHMHALSMHYYEVVQIFRVEVGPNDAVPVLFVPFKPLDFSDRYLVLRYRQALRRAALDRTTRDLLEAVSDFVRMTPRFDVEAAVEDRLGAVGGQLKDDDEISMPGDNHLVGLDVDGAEVELRVHRDDGPTVTVQEGTDGRYRLDSPVDVADVDGIDATVTGQITGVDDGDDLDRTIVIEHTGNASTYFELDVSGRLEQAYGELDGFDVSRTDVNTSNGRAGRTMWKDAFGFRFSGALDRLSFSNDNFVVYLDGVRWESGRAAGLPEDGNVYVDGQLWATSAEGSRGSDGSTVDVRVSFDVERPDGNRTARIAGTATVRPGVESFRVVDVATFEEFDELVRRLNEEQLYYSQAVWKSMDARTISMLLGEYTIDGRNAAEFLDPTPEATHGNYVVFPLAIPESPEDATDETYAKLAAWWDDWTDRNFDPGHRERDLVPLPTGGVHGESILGRANGAEKLDITRFWDWQESPIPQQAPEIAPVQTGTRASAEDLTPGGFDPSIVQMQQPQSLPDPTGVGAVLDTLGRSGIFRDMSGMEAAAEVAKHTSQISGEGASHAADTAARTFEAAARAQNQALSTITDAITSASGGEYSAPNAGNSSFGAALNEAMKMGASPGANTWSTGANGIGSDGGGGSPDDNGTSGWSSGSDGRSFLAGDGGSDLPTRMVAARAAGSNEPLIGDVDGGDALGDSNILTGSAGTLSSQPRLDEQAGREYHLAMEGIGEWTWRARKLWTLVERAKTMRYPDEPGTNVDRLPIPPWIDSEKWRKTIENHYTREHQELLDEDPETDFTREPSNVLGDFDQPVTAEYFVIHNPTETPSENFVGSGQVHQWLGADTIEMNLDWHERGNGVKIEEGDASCFVHVEMSVVGRDRREHGTGKHTFQQYYDLANAYLAASLRAGRFLTVTAHKEVDRSLENGHDDPVDVNVQLFYDMIALSLAQGDVDGSQHGFGRSVTFGIDQDRIDTGNGQGEINEFIPYLVGNVPKADQYGDVRTPGPNGQNFRSTDIQHHTNGTYGGLYEEDQLRSLDRQCGGGDWPDEASAPPVPDAAKPYLDDVSGDDGDDGEDGILV